VPDATSLIQPGADNTLPLRVLNPDNQPIDGIVLPETPHRNKLVLLPVELLLTPAVRIVSLHLRPDWKNGLVRIDCELNSACIGATGCAVRSERKYVVPRGL
jgi:hypothetical protein